MSDHIGAVLAGIRLLAGGVMALFYFGLCVWLIVVPEEVLAAGAGVFLIAAGVFFLALLANSTR